MYSLLRERNQAKDLALQVVHLGIAGLTTEKFVEFLVEERNIFPESFALESAIFLAIWFGLDLVSCSILRFRSILQSFGNRVIARRCLTTLAVSWIVAAIFFKFYSFLLEFSAMLGLWLLLDFLSTKLSRKDH